MLTIAADNPEPPPPSPGGNRRWTTAAAGLAGLAVLVLFGMTMLFIFRPDPNRKMLDRIDNLSDCGAAPRTFRGLYAMESAMLADAVGDADPRLESELRAAAARYDPAAREGEAC